MMAMRITETYLLAGTHPTLVPFIADFDVPSRIHLNILKLVLHMSRLLCVKEFDILHEIR